METYVTHDNGGRPFQVIIGPGQTQFCACIKKLKDNSAEYEDLFTICYTKLFVGKSPQTKATLFSGGFGPEFDGNSILLQVDDALNYVFVGQEIFSFTTESPIDKFVSPVGNNDVPYPFAITENEKVYFLIEYVMAEYTNEMENDPYDILYTNKKISGKKTFVYKMLQKRLW